MNRNILSNKLLQRVFWVALIASCWELLAVSGMVSPLIFPRMEQIIKALFYSVKNGDLLNQIYYSMLLISKGLIIGVTGAVLMASLSMVSEIFRSFIETITAIAHPLPGIALLPLVILWFGTGTTSITVVIVHSVVWPLYLNISSGFRSVPRIYKELGRNFGLNSLKISVAIMIPASMPYLLSGLKIGWARAWRALISAEMIFGAIGGKGGLGWYIFKQRVFMDTPGIFAGIIVIVVIGIVVEDLIFNRIEDSTVKKWGMSG